MRAAIFDEPGLTNLEVMDNVNKPQINDHDVLVRVKVAGVNWQFCYFTCFTKNNSTTKSYTRGRNKRNSGEVGSHVKKYNLKKEDRVVIHDYDLRLLY
jgi:hypothetical protein